jgi:predicted MFS family arabinose efflux permease
MAGAGVRTVRTWARDTAGGLPAAFWYLWTGTLVNRLGSFVNIFLAIYLTQARGFTAAAAGLVVGLGGAGGAVGTLLGGVLADRWGRRPTLLTAHLGAATMMTLLGFTRPYLAIAGGVLLLGAFTEMVRPAFSAMMVDVVPDRDRLRAFSLNYWAINVGFACAAVLAGLAAQASYLALFVVDAATTVVTAAIVFLKVRETRPPRAAQSAHPVIQGAGLRAVFGDRVFLPFVGVNLMIAFVFLQHSSTLPIAMSRDGLSPATFGWVIALNGVLIVGGQLFVPRLINGRAQSRVLALAGVIIGIGFGLTAFADAAPLYALTVLIWTMGEMLHSPSTSTLVARLSPAALRGRYQGVLSLSWSIAAFAAPTLGGLVQEHAGSRALWLGCGAVAVVAAGAHLVSGPARERRARALDAGLEAVPARGPAEPEPALAPAG